MQLLNTLNSNILKHIKFYPWLIMLFMGLFLTANLVAQKIIALPYSSAHSVQHGWQLLFNAGDLVFPFMYLISLVVTEVYGFTLSRYMVWGAAIGSLPIFALLYLTITVPAAACWPHQMAYQLVLGRTPRILAASLFSFLLGEFCSTYLFAKIKLWQQGRFLWFRTSCATITGQFLDSYLFTIAAFAYTISWREVLLLSFGAWLAKMFFQAICTPLVYALAYFLKQREGLDVFDKETNFNPFSHFIS